VDRPTQIGVMQKLRGMANIVGWMRATRKVGFSPHVSPIHLA